jgi:MFS family permease
VEQTKFVRQPGRAATAAFIGTTIEWYDFYIYATASALFFGKLFFPSSNDFVGTMASFGTFAAGFLARPFGGALFGHWGDRVGRKKALMVTLTLMGIATIGIGVLPTYAQAGPIAPILLITLRLVQGFAVGGEWGGAVLMAGEHASEKRRTFLTSFAQLGSPAGLILSLIFFRGISGLSEEKLLDWGWRLPFLCSAVLLLVGVCIRIGVAESPEFAKAVEEGKKARLPVLEVVQTAWRTIGLCMGACTVSIAGIYFTNTFMLAYTTQTLGLDRKLILDCLFVVALFQFCIQPIAAYFAEKVGTERFLIIAALASIVAPYPMFMLVQTGRPPMIVAGILVVLVFMAALYSAMAGFISQAFETRVRYSGISLSYQLCGAIAGGLTPLVGALIAHRFPGNWVPLAIFYSGLSFVTFACIARLTVRKRRMATLSPVTS